MCFVSVTNKQLGVRVRVAREEDEEDGYVCVTWSFVGHGENSFSTFIRQS